MSVTKQEAAALSGGEGARTLGARQVAPARGEDRYPEWNMGFDEFMRRMHSDAKARNDVKWIKRYEEWLANMPRDDPEEYIERSRRAFMDRVRRENDRDIERSLDRRLDARIAKGCEERLDARIKRRFERQTERQIMVDNFEVFRREYINMVIRRSC